MKKFIFSFLPVFVLTGFVFPQGLSLTQPNPGSKWIKGRTYTILWTGAGRSLSHVEISIISLENRRFTRVIAKKTPNNGQYRWNIPQDIPAGKYEVRLRAVNGTSVTRSKVFQIQDPPKTMRTTSKKRNPALQPLSPLDPSLKSQQVRIEQNLIPQTRSKLNRLVKSLYADMKRMKVTEFHQVALNKARKSFPNISQKALDVVLFYCLDAVDEVLRRDIQELQTMSDMSELDMMALQDAMNKEAQLMQMMSNMLKMMHDTQMSIIRNIK